MNHDEGVYLRQAAMLLEGKLFLRPPVEDAFRPWFFVEAGDRLYPKYAPVPAAMFAVGLAVGRPRLALALVGAAVVAGVYGVTREAFHADDPATVGGRRTALLAAALAVASPQFLVETAVFLPYAPTAAWNLLFAFAYLRADRLAPEGGGDSWRPGRRTLAWATVAGTAVGVAFFARPYTAVLFAAPFVAHALWSLVAADGERVIDRRALARLLPTAALGLGGVGVALAYNLVVTGDPLVFPYQAFAPRDGLGFGYHEILSYGRVYSPWLALRANVRVLWALATDWAVAGLLGVALAAVGVGRLCRRGRSADPRRLALAGLFGSVVVGNVYFWGNLNVLGAVAEPGDGLIHYLGPYYHYDLLVALSAFGARGGLVVGDWLRDRLPDVLVARTGISRAAGARVGMAALVAGTAVLGAAAAETAGEPLARNRQVSDQLGAAYEPFDDRELSNAVVFLPTPYGDWLGHPFQALRNDPGYDEGTIYAMRENQFAVVDAFPDRRLYRYTYRGQWAPFVGDAVEARLQRIHHVRGERVVVRTTLGTPEGAESVGIRLAGANGSAYFGATGPPDELTLRLVLQNGTATLRGPDLRAVGSPSVAMPDRGHLVLQVNVGLGHGRSFTYRLRVPVAREGGDVRALTPYVEVCGQPRLCGGQAAHVPGTHREGVSVTTHIRAAGRENRSRTT